MPLDAPPILLTDTLDDPEGRIQVDDGARSAGLTEADAVAHGRPDRDREQAAGHSSATPASVARDMPAPVLGRIAVDWILEGLLSVIEDAERLLPGRVIA